MLHNSDPFGSSEAPLNMGASVNMTLNGPMNIPNGFNMGKVSHEASQSSNTHNLASYPSYGYPVMSPHTPMHHFQNFHSNVFQSSFMGHNTAALHDTSWQHGLLPMNLNTHADNSPNMNFYDRKDFGYSDYKDQNLHSKSVPLNVPQVYSKAYHKEVSASHTNYNTYQDPGTLRSYDKTYLDNNLDLTMNKAHKPETRSYDLDLSIKPPTLDESRRRSLENTVKMIENILIHNPTSSSSHSMSQMKHAQTLSALGDNKNMYNEKCESKNTYDERLSSKNIYAERTDYKSVSNERPDNKNIYNERSDKKNIYSERSDPVNIYNPKNMYEDTSDRKNMYPKTMYNERSEPKNLYSERSDPNTMYNERSDPINLYNNRTDPKNLYNDRTDPKNLYNERLDPKNLYNERSNLKNPFNERSDPKNLFNERSDPKNLYNERSDPKNIFNERTDPKNLYNERSDPKNIFNERLDPKNLYNERSDPKNIFNERSDPKNLFNERSDPKNLFNERSDPKSVYNEQADTKKLCNEVLYNKNVFDETSVNKVELNKTLDDKNDSNKLSDDKDIYRDRTDTEKNTNDEPKTEEQSVVNEEKDINVAESSKNDDNTNIKSIYSCSTENSIESEINSDERNNNFGNSSENENNDSINEESSENQIEKVEIKVELHSNDSESESDDVKPLASYATRNPLEVYTEVSQSDNGIEVKVEELSSWADSEQCNPFQRDIFGVTHDCTIDGTVIDAESSVKAAKDATGTEPSDSTFYQCPSCTLYFTNPKRFLIHTKWHSLRLPIERKNEMEIERVMKRNMRKEARKVWKMNNEEIKDGNVGEGEVFKCNSCEKMFSTRASLKNHKQRFHPTLVRECLICHKTLVGWQAIKTHRATEHTSLSDSRYQCTECPKQFKFSHSLVKHLDTHLEKTHGCELCPKMFGSQKLLSTHMKTHERFMRGMTFHCSYCGKGFFESYQLQVHERTHRNERPFLCEICNTSFGTNSSLQRHLKVSHSSAKPWQCSTCHRNFVSEKIRDRHVLRHHGDQENFKFLCTQCPCRYLNQKDLNKHVQKNHPRPGRKKRSRKTNDSD